MFKCGKKGVRVNDGNKGVEMGKRERVKDGKGIGLEVGKRRKG